MFDKNKPIPTIPFPQNKIPVCSPKNESMMYLNNYFICDSFYYKWKENNRKPIPGSSPYIIARKTVVEKLLEAERLLPEGYKFKIYDAYRPIIIQQYLWDYYYEKIKKENKNKKENELKKLTSFYVSFPSYNVLEPSLHNTGGAVDLTIVDETGKELNMGCEIDSFSEKSWTNHYENDYEKSENDIKIRNNRRLLYNVMTEAGFTNLPSEYWHYDYGNDKWAQLNKTAPFYAGMLNAKIIDQVPFENSEIIQEIDNTQQILISELIDIRDKFKELELTLKKSLF